LVVLRANLLDFTHILVGRKRERGDWGDTSAFGSPPPNKIPRPRLGEEMLRVLTRSSVCDIVFVRNLSFLYAGCWLYHWEGRLQHKTS